LGFRLNRQEISMGIGHIEFRPDEGGVFPMQIAEHEALTAREKLDLLITLRAEVSALQASAGNLDFVPGDVEAAIEAVKRSAALGETDDAPARGSY
jgi:hypothetical protein